MNDNPHLAILLATYNGEKYLDEQISDATPEILAKWAAAYPEKICVISDDRGNLRSLANFSRLLELCCTPYFAFCDQDDIWLPKKVELTVNEVRRLEREFGAGTPILVHSDLTVVDEKLKVISPSLFRHLQIDPVVDRRLDRLIFNNVVTGCASLGNRALLELGRPVPTEIPFHDWWLALVAASCGIVSTVAEPTILYRQHDRNQVGAGPQRKRKTIWDGRHVLQQPRLLKVRMAKAMGIVQSQANVLLRTVGDKMPQRNRDFLCAFCLPLRI